MNILISIWSISFIIIFIMSYKTMEKESKKILVDGKTVFNIIAVNLSMLMIYLLSPFFVLMMIYELIKRGILLLKRLKLKLKLKALIKKLKSTDDIKYSLEQKTELAANIIMLEAILETF